MVLDLDPFVFQIGSFGVRWYGFFMAISIAIGFYYLIKHGSRRGLNEDHLYNLAILAVVGGIIGARLIYVATNWGDYAAYPLEIIRIDHGGLSWHGALLGGMLPVWWYGRRRGISFRLIADLAVPGLAVGYMLVRIGNIFNQEIVGRITQLGFDRHPTQIYGSLIGLVLLILHNYLARRRPPDGYLFWSFILWYQVLRGVVEETFRDNPLYTLGYVNEVWGMGFFTLTQLITPPLVLFALWMIFRIRRHAADADDGSLSRSGSRQARATGSGDS